MTDVEAISGSAMGPGTLYGALARLERRGLIEALEPVERRRPYRLTGAGRGDRARPAGAAGRLHRGPASAGCGRPARDRPRAPLSAGLARPLRGRVPGGPRRRDPRAGATGSTSCSRRSMRTSTRRCPSGARTEARRAGAGAAGRSRPPGWPAIGGGPVAGDRAPPCSWRRSTWTVTATPPPAIVFALLGQLAWPARRSALADGCPARREAGRRLVVLLVGGRGPCSSAGRGWSLGLFAGFVGVVIVGAVARRATAVGSSGRSWWSRRSSPSA